MIIMAPKFTAKDAVIDLKHLGNLRQIACYVLDTGDGLALVDPGPSVCLETLIAGLGEEGKSLADIRHILLTHIHLDHAGVTGTLVRRNPQIRVYVHERGAKHMVDPEKLLRSAERLWGDRLGTLWGEFLPVPTENVQALAGGETITAGSRKLDVSYTPGHAWHHVTYFDSLTGTAFVGDTAGIRISGSAVVPAAPPPDIDLLAWEQSLRNIEERRPARIFLTHFGAWEPVDWHLGELRSKLADWAERARISLERDTSDEERASTFASAALAELKRNLSPQDFKNYENTSGPASSWYGLARYWRKLAEKPSQS
jgi:glyoxylase-like metal-dependent hydrolase (beta-lactamase superfamily II)